VAESPAEPTPTEPFAEPFIGPSEHSPARHRRALMAGVIGAVASAAVGCAGFAMYQGDPAKATGPAPGSVLASNSGSAASASTSSPASDAAANPGTGSTGSLQAFASPVSTAFMLPAGDVASAMIPVPANGSAAEVTDASPDGSMTLDEFMNAMYPSSPNERSRLMSLGFERAAERCMYMPQGQQDCFYLVVFLARAGAQDYTLGLATAFGSDSANASDTQFSAPGLIDGVGFENPALDAYGNTYTVVFGTSENVAVVVEDYTPSKPARAEMLTLVAQQTARLTAAEGAG
jgi:hypothetical protein